MNSLLGPVNTSNSINIRRDVQDLFYRYKMPRLQSKIEGKGNGIKTVIPNMTDIAKALARPPSYITKYFGAELGALSTCDEKAAKYIINGAHDAEKLQTVLDGFIGKFVLCQKCDNPETILTVSKKDGTIYRTCQACGHKGTVDMAHKVVSYIRANPPPKPAKRSQAKDRAGAADGMMAVAPSGIDDDDDKFEGIVAPDDFDDTIAHVKVAATGDDGDWAEDTAAAARAAELSSLSESVRNKLAITNQKEDKLAMLDAFGNELEERQELLSNDEILEKINKSSIPAYQAITVIVQVLFVSDFFKTFKLRLPLLESLLNKGGEKERQALLGSFERLVGIVKPELLQKTPMILQTFYNADLVDEDVLLTWREKPLKKYVSKEIAVKVRDQAKPFFEWLESAQSDNDDEEEEDEEDSDNQDQ